jgi:hypothetical protein
MIYYTNKEILMESSAMIEKEIYSTHVENKVETDYERTFLLKRIAHLISPRLCKINELSETQKENVIYSDQIKNDAIVINDKSVSNYICAIKDKKYDNKYLIIYTLMESRYTNYVFGFFVYFDNTPNSWSNFPRKYHFVSKSIMRLSHKCQIPSSNNTILYDDVLFMCDHFCETRGSIFRFVKFDTSFDTRDETYINLIWYDAKYSTQIIGEFVNNNDSPHLAIIEMHGRCQYDLGGWETQKFNEQNKKFIIFDLESITKNSDKLNFTVYMTDDYEKCISQNLLVKKETKPPLIYDGYPLVCKKCNQETSNVFSEIQRMNYNSYSCQTQSFGASFCKDCMIRFSLTKGQWMCCKPVIKNNEIYACENILTKDSMFVCEKEHKEYNEDKIKVECNVSRQISPPYLNSGTVRYRFKNL